VRCSFRAFRTQDTIDAIMRVLRIRHITLAVRDLDLARSSLASLFGADAADVLKIEAFGARTQDLTLGESTLQLVSPTERDGALQRFLERRGEGVYTVALEVDDLEAAIAELAEHGIRVSAPVDAQPGLRTAFVAASATHGMSVQLVESTQRGEQTPPTVHPALEPADEPPLPEEQPDRPAPGEPPLPRRALDLTPDEWEEWSDVD
jgi:methylmalonyl-CoA epimerase